VAPASSATAVAATYLAVFGAVLLALVNGSFYSPIYDSVDQVLYLFARGSLHAGPLSLQPYRTSIFIAAMTFLLAGIPAALYERIRGLERTTPLSATVWFLTTLLMSLPALQRAVGAD